MFETNEVSTFLSPDIKLLYDRAKNINHHGKEESDCNQSVMQKLDFFLLNVKDYTCLENKISVELLEEFVTLLRELPPIHLETDYEVFNLTWTTMEHVLRKTITWLANPNKCYHYMALLQICSVVERVLGKVYQLEGNSVPFLLRDLVNTIELKNIIGSQLVHLLKIFIGSVHGFNFRNIAWHGFLGIEDIYKEHSVVLLYILHKCGDILKKKNLNISFISHVMDLQMTFNYCEKNMKFEFDEEDSMEIIINSKLVYKVMLPLWQEAVHLISIRKCNDALLLLLPLLENSLRILYATVNDCHVKILTATNSTFYITMDEILSPWIKSSDIDSTDSDKQDGQEDKDKDFVSSSGAQHESLFNLVPQYLGRPLTESLYDLFHYISGPRLRDRASHGEIFPIDVSFETIRNLFRLCLLVLSVDRWRFSQESKFTIKCSCESYEAINKCTHHYPSDLEKRILTDSISQNFPTLTFRNFFLVSYLTSYEVAFHPAAILKRDLLYVLFMIKNWKEWKHPQDSLEFTWEECSVSLNANYKWVNIFGNYTVKSLFDIEIVIRSLSKPLETTLFSAKVELEIIRTLQRISNAIKKSLVNIEGSLQTKYALFVSKSLRSRQRETYIKQLETIPTIIHHLFICLQMIYFILESYYHWRHVETSLYSSLKKILKNVLKAAENLLSFTDPSVNNYHTALTKLTENTNLINNYFQSNSENNKI